MNHGWALWHGTGFSNNLKANPWTEALTSAGEDDEHLDSGVAQMLSLR